MLLEQETNWQDDSAPALTSMTTTVLKDSGARQVFDTGAVRDISKGKGRCDLLPLTVIGRLLGRDVFAHIENFKLTKDPNELHNAIKLFCLDTNVDIFTTILEVSKHYEDGAAKYSENNWMKGIDLHCFIDSGVRHLIKFYKGDTDEPHDRAFIWNMLGAIWTLSNRPELDDIMLDL